MSNDYAETAAYFKRVTAGHQVTVLHEDGMSIEKRASSPELWIATWRGARPPAARSASSSAR